MCFSTYCSSHCSSGATRVENSNLCFIAEIVQCKDLFLILQQNNLGKKAMKTTFAKTNIFHVLIRLMV